VETPRAAWRRTDRWAFAAILAATAAGLALRIAAGTGALWLDEAWSAVFARDARTPLGVLWLINHDNNHHLNTLWMQWVGFDAPPLAQRALAIASGTLTIPVAAAIGWRRSRAAAVIAAGLFALSPVLVCYGSEARGYAPMLLAFTAAILLVDRWLAAPERPPRTPSLAIALGLGFLAQATILFGLAALLGWAAIERRRQVGTVTVAREMARLFGPALLTIFTMGALMWLAAHRSPYGFSVGGLEPHSWSGWRNALAELLRYTLGWPLLLAVVVPVALLVAPRSRLRGLALWSVFAFPLVLALLALPNSMMPRYYLVASVALLLWLAEWLAQLGARSRLLRTGVAITLLALAGAMLWADRLLIENQRGDPGAAITLLAALAPTGTTVMVEQHRESAVLDAAAAYRHYPLVAQIAPCPAAPFLLADRHGTEQFAGTVHACGHSYVALATHRAEGPSGLHWQLLGRRD
jgi:4-amino-4-deoxy-L-arabinose transferase-like glycosyltransferase